MVNNSNNVDLATPNKFICKILVEIWKIKNYHLIGRLILLVLTLHSIQ
jgi:hypothetical protein